MDTEDEVLEHWVVLKVVDHHVPTPQLIPIDAPSVAHKRPVVGQEVSHAGCFCLGIRLTAEHEANEPIMHQGTWGQIQREILESRDPISGGPDFDGIRRKYLRLLAEHTKRNLIVYESAGFAPPPGTSPDDTQIALPDVNAFMEVVHGLDRTVALDLILHSPGGTAEAAESIVEYLRGRFPGLRVIVPIAAMSAATMMSMAADRIVMGAHSQLGPIDPQLTIITPQGPCSAPAEAIRQQFIDARKDLAEHPEHTAAWLPILSTMAPALLQRCEDAMALSKTIGGL